MTYLVPKGGVDGVQRFDSAHRFPRTETLSEKNPTEFGHVLGTLSVNAGADLKLVYELIADFGLRGAAPVCFGAMTASVFPAFLVRRGVVESKSAVRATEWGKEHRRRHSQSSASEANRLR